MSRGPHLALEPSFLTSAKVHGNMSFLIISITQKWPRPLMPEVAGQLFLVNLGLGLLLPFCTCLKINYLTRDDVHLPGAPG